MYRFFRRVHFSVSVSALITLLVGLILTMLLFASVRRVESALQNAQFQQSAKLRTAAVAVGMLDAVEQLVVVNQLFRTFGVISREQFHSFTAPPAGTLPANPGTQFPAPRSPGRPTRFRSRDAAPLPRFHDYRNGRRPAAARRAPR
jgi:hypothetical protein